MKNGRMPHSTFEVGRSMFDVLGFGIFWMPDQVRHDDPETFFESIADYPFMDSNASQRANAFSSSCSTSASSCFTAAIRWPS